jgi:hypothetical protein
VQAIGEPVRNAVHIPEAGFATTDVDKGPFAQHLCLMCKNFGQYPHLDSTVAMSGKNRLQGDLIHR